MNIYCGRKIFWVSIHHAIHIFPYCYTFRIQDVCKNGCGIIAALAAKRGAFVFIGAADKPLRKDKIIFFKKRNNRVFNLFGGYLPVNSCIAKIIICAKQVSYIYPFIRNFFFL